MKSLTQFKGRVITYITHTFRSDASILRVVVVAVAAFIVYFTIVAFLRHENYYSLRLDLGNMSQTVWNVMSGHGFTLTDPMSENQMSRLAAHADFLLIVIAPLYRLWTDPKLLILIQAIVLGIGAIPLFWIAKRKTGSRVVALVLSVSYLLYPPLHRSMLYDFHAVTLATTFLLYAYWAMEEKRWLPFIMFALLSASTKEQVWLQIALMGGAIALRKETRWFGVSVALVSIGAFYYLLWHVIPSVTISGQHFAMSYFSEFGSDQTGVLRGMLLEPWKVISTVFAYDRQYYLFQLFAPVGFLALTAPWALLFALPNLAINLLSNNGLMRLIDFQYTSTITPFLFIAAAEGWRGIQKNVGYGWGRGVLYGWFAAWLLMSVYLWGELPIGRESKYWLYTSPQTESTIMDLVIREIPSSASVSVSNNIGAHLSHREFFYNFPIATHSADYILAKVDDPNAWPSLGDQKRVVEELMIDPTYELLIQSGTFTAFRKR